MLFEQEKSTLSPCGNSEKPDSEKAKQSEEKPMEGIEEDSPLQKCYSKCYMNSVLQVLGKTRQFCKKIFCKKPESSIEM